MLDNYLAWLLVGVLVCALLQLLVADRHKSRKARSGRSDHYPDTLKSALDAMHAFSAAGRASSAGAVSLKRLFTLNNPFVSGSEELRHLYRQALVKAFAKVDSRAWDATARSVATSIKPLIRAEIGMHGTHTMSVNVMAISQQAALVAVLKALFNIDGVPRPTLVYIGSEIHHLGIWKKHLDTHFSGLDIAPEGLLRRVDRLVHVLRRLFSTARETNDLARDVLCHVSGTRDEFNPLDLLIPAFEAPWRGVFYTLLAVLQQGPERADDLVSLRDGPAAARPPPRAIAVVYEALRLYQPIRRMRMARKAGRRDKPGGGGAQVQGLADIDQIIDAEAILRDPWYWGPTAAEWRPSRFLHPNGEMNGSVLCEASGWVPFAAGAMKCPSAGGFSARMTALVAGEILRQLFSEEGPPRWHLDGPEWDSSSAAAGGLLRPGREEYTSVEVVVARSRPQSPAC